MSPEEEKSQKDNLDYAKGCLVNARSYLIIAIDITGEVNTAYSSSSYIDKLAISKQLEITNATVEEDINPQFFLEDDDDDDDEKPSPW